MLNTRAIFYTGKLWLVEGEATIDQAWFEALAGEATLVVLGEVQLEPTLDPAQLATHVHQVHNLGEVVGTPAQLAALQARVGLNEGEWTNSTTKSDEPIHESVIGNIAYLEL